MWCHYYKTSINHTFGLLFAQGECGHNVFTGELMVRLLRKSTSIVRLKLINITCTSTLWLCPFKKFQQPPSDKVQGCGFIHQHHKHALSQTEAQDCYCHTSSIMRFYQWSCPEIISACRLTLISPLYLNGIWYWFLCVKAATKQTTADKIPNKWRIPQEICLNWILKHYYTIHCAVEKSRLESFFAHLVMLLRILRVVKAF